MLRHLARRTITSQPKCLNTTFYRALSTSRHPSGNALQQSQYRGVVPSLIQANSRRRSTPLALHCSLRSEFHSSPPRRGPPLLLALLKTSTALEVIRTAARIVLTFVPIILLKNHGQRRYLRHVEFLGKPASEEKKAKVLKSIRTRTIVFHILLSIPAFLFWATIVASMERTPITGRWRLIILSPEEEEEIATTLAGPGWYNAVSEILAQEGPVRLIPTNDWRYVWVRDTLRQLEDTIPILVRERELCPEWLASSPQDRPLPPPAEYPLRPRPRASEYLRSFCEAMSERHHPPVAHTVPGPPYNVLLVEKPDALNAFSYGFGPNGGGGIVVYSGFLDDIFSRIPQEYPKSSQPQSWWSSIFGSVFSSTSPRPVPTKEQTAELAILLAHELSHLILSHHLETLSSGTVIVPGTISVFSDILRVLIFPITMVFGPFVNDAIAQLGKIGSGELVKVGDYCTSMKQEIEADVVSARLLAHAGFDARDAISFWEQRAFSVTECAHAEPMEPNYSGEKLSKSEGLARRIMGSAHPVNEVRVDKLKSELVRWETERRAALLRLKNKPQESSVSLLGA
ncbi:hypothetical protein PM082_016069 [Marasmius tenuissimus]|nr:hypothetical protein PM082_016069 [Marasmius tenuissimus]